MSFRNAQLKKKVIYYFSNPLHGGTGEILMGGLSEHFPAPEGYEKIVCATVADAERWSGRMRIWEAAKEDIAQSYQRYKEAQQVEAIRSEFKTKIANARNQVNRDFMIQSLANFDKRYEDKYKMERTSYLHAEGYEENHKEVATPKIKQPHRPFHGKASLL